MVRTSDVSSFELRNTDVMRFSVSKLRETYHRQFWMSTCFISAMYEDREKERRDCLTIQWNLKLYT